MTPRDNKRFAEVILFQRSFYNVISSLSSGRYLAYNSISGASALWDKREYEIYQSVDGEVPAESESATYEVLYYGGFIVERGYDERVVLEDEYKSKRFDQSSMMLTIAPTLACNFGCDYCFQGQGKPSDSMSESVQTELISLVKGLNSRIRHLQVAWYGGEPLLKVSIIESLTRRMLETCQTKKVSYSASMVSNGYKFGVDTAMRLKNLRVRTIQITLDGSQSFHDSRRGTLGGRPTFSRIVNNIKNAIDSVNIRVSVRINIDRRNVDGIPCLLDKLSESGLANSDRFSVYFAPVEAVTAGCSSVEDHCMSKTEYGLCEVELTKYAHSLGLMRLPYPRRFLGNCGAVRPNGLVVAPNGDLHKCWDTISIPSSKVGTVFSPAVLHTNQMDLEWLKWNPFENRICRDCKLLPNCAGACAHKFINSDQTYGESASLPCPSWKYNVREKIFLLAEGSGLVRTDEKSMSQTDPRHLVRRDTTNSFGAIHEKVGLTKRYFPLAVKHEEEVAVGSGV